MGFCPCVVFREFFTSWSIFGIISTSFLHHFDVLSKIYIFMLSIFPWKRKGNFSKIILVAFFTNSKIRLLDVSKNEFQVGYSDSIKEGIDVKGFRLWRHSTQEKKPKKQQRTRQEHYRLLSKSSKDLGKLQCSKSSILIHIV